MGGRIRAYTLRQKKKQEEEEAAEADRKRQEAERIRQEAERKQKIIDDRRRKNSVRLTPQHYGLSNSTMGFNGDCASRISQCEGLWRNLSSSDPLKEEKQWAVAIFMYTNKGGINYQFYKQLNKSLRARQSTYSEYTKILTEALLYITEQQNYQLPDTLYRGISLERFVSLNYENQNFTDFAKNNQFSSFTTRRDVADNFAFGRFNSGQSRNNVPTILKLTRAKSAKIAYIGDRYGISNETEWLAPPDTSYNVGNYSKVKVKGEQGFQVNLTPVNQRRRLALQMNVHDELTPQL